MHADDGSVDDELAPAVRSILEAARDRAGDERGSDDSAHDPVDVDARSLQAAFERAETAGLVPTIAEVKPTSPTTEGKRSEDPVALAEAMVEGGAAAISVLTEPEHFGGSMEALEAVRAAVDVPVLRKDFLLEEAQLDIVESDLVLLIARFLEEDLDAMLEAARDRGFQALVEVHTRDELERAIAAGASIVGVNNRDLARLEVDLGTFESVAPEVPDNVTLVAESGIATRDDVRRMRTAGADGLLVGSSIMAGVEPGDSGDGRATTVDDVIANTRELTRAEAEAGEDAGGSR